MKSSGASRVSSLQPRQHVDEAQPGLFEQVFGDVAAARQPRQKVEQAGVERGMHLVEGGRIGAFQPGDQGELELPLHTSHNALDTGL